MNGEVTCGKCGDICEVDGEYPEFFAWCEECGDYAVEDMTEYAADYAAGIMDSRPGA